jgi:NADH-quinone oxidoreductase subunit M
MLAGGVPLLIGFLLLAFNHAAQTGAGLAFDLPTLLATTIPGKTELVIFLLLLLGFAVKVPLFPLHTWLPVMTMEGPVAVTALLVGLKLGAYGLIRFAIPLAPDAAHELHWLLAGLGTVAVLYGAVTALAQTNLRQMLAYSSLSHVGLVVLGLSSFNLQGLQGSVLQLLNFTVAAGGLFLLTGFLHHRIGSTDIISLGGSARSMPLLASFYLLFGLAAMGLPGTNGFPAELLILLSALKTHTGAGLAGLFAMVVSAAYFLGIYRRSFFGPITNPVVADAADLRPRELAIVLVAAAIILVVGFYPSLVLDVIKPAGEAWVSRLR